MCSTQHSRAACRHDAAPQNYGQDLKRIAILGAGGQAREILWLIRDINRDLPTYEFLGFIVSDASKPGKYDTPDHVLGDESWLAANSQQVDCLAIGIGTPSVRRAVADNLANKFLDRMACAHSSRQHPRPGTSHRSRRFIVRWGDLHN